MDLFYIASVLALQVIFSSSVYCDSGCENVVCPEQLECRYPKVNVVWPDPLNKDCCNVTDCICEGTNSLLSSSHDSNVQYESLVLRYTNCTVIDGNLEIVAIQPKGKDANFTIDVTKNIRTVTGYVLIALNYVHYIDLSSLRLIRGEKLYDENPTKKDICGQASPEKKNTIRYSLFVSANFDTNDKSKGLRGIHMPNLAEIMKGHVKINGNRDLCFIDTIIWEEEIFNSEEQKATVTDTGGSSCGACPSSCFEKSVNSAHCWGNSVDLCQKFTRIPCKDVCSKQQRCSQPSVKGGNRRCCETYCAAGCSSSGVCHDCKAFNNFGECVTRCPAGADSGVTDDVVTDIDKDKIRYELFLFCVKECPSTRRVLEAERKCVLTCPRNYYEEDGYCKECPPGGCSNICYGLEAKLGPLKNDGAIHSGNIGNFTKNCTVIEGSLSFTQSSFEGDTHCKILPIANQSAFDVFENVEEITGFLSVEHWPYKDLCIFRNLKRIRGLEKRHDAYSLVVMTHGKDLRQLCFNSLEEIESGLVYIFGNTRLCHVKSLNWEYMFKRPLQKSTVDHNSKKPKRCLPCDDSCDPKNGCWGPKSYQCVTCKNFTDYTNENGKFAEHWVTDPVTGKSVPGHNVTNCVQLCGVDKGVYATSDKKCFPCDSQCNITCSGPGPMNCTTRAPNKHGCKNVLFGHTCVATCPLSHYPDVNQICQPCSSGCLDGGCKGPDDEYSQTGCDTCYMKYDDDSKLFIYRGPACQVCLTKLQDSECALGCTYDNATEAYACYDVPSAVQYIWIPVICVILALVIAIFIIYFKCRKTIRTMSKHIEEKIVGDAAQSDEFGTPLTPSGTAPNRAQLRMVKENELSFGKELGSGAFGAVYKAVWTSMHIEGQTIKIAVAVKQLKTFSHNSEIMDEAYVMASVDSPYLIRLLGICMTEQVSLITQLMPLGSLLEYVRGNVDNIGSRHMLTWCMQIAKGMQYLEDKHLVHRDLAARNVLVKTPHHVKITDFGLSKMLNATQSVYLAEGGKLPIKWLAMECITERKFSHQSDVWAFGVTCWEIFTFGARPYEGVRAVDVLSLLERGDRLVQPSVCTIEVYMLLVKCWLVDPLSRPKFAHLVEEFTQMCHDHARYLVVQNDSSPGIMSPNPDDEKRFFERLIREDNIDVDGELVDDPDMYLLSNGPLNEPEYENQPVIDQQQGANPGTSGGGSHGARLFSRNTPSAQIPTPPATSHMTVDPLINEINSSHPRVSDSSNPDDVFSNSGQSIRNGPVPTKSMTVDLPSPEKGAESLPVRFRQAQSGNPWSPGRKDSEENSRYTEDPTTHNRSSAYVDPTSTPSTVDHDVLSTSDHPDGMIYDEEEYLLPTPQLASSTDYFDPSKPYPKNSGIQKHVEENARNEDDEFPAALTNTTYIESGEMPSSHPSSWPNQFVSGRPTEEAEYMNSSRQPEYLNWNGDRSDTMMSDVMKEEETADKPLLGNHASASPGTARPDDVTYFNNEEYMATDSGIGEDNHSVLSASNSMNRPHGTHPRQTSRNRQNSSLSSGGSSSNGSLGPLMGNSPVHHARLSSDEQQMDLERGVVRFKPVPKPRSQSKKSQKSDVPSTSIGLDNPEYMMLQESVSDSKALLSEEVTDD